MGALPPGRSAQYTIRHKDSTVPQTEAAKADIKWGSKRTARISGLTQDLRGHNDLSTTVVYTHNLNRGAGEVSAVQRIAF